MRRTTEQTTRRPTLHELEHAANRAREWFRSFADGATTEEEYVRAQVAADAPIARRAGLPEGRLAPDHRRAWRTAESAIAAWEAAQGSRRRRATFGPSAPQRRGVRFAA